MSTTRRGFLKLLGIGSVAVPTLLKAALKKPDVPVPVVTTGYCQVITSGSSAVMFNQENYVGEYQWSQVFDNEPVKHYDFIVGPEQARAIRKALNKK